MLPITALALASVWLIQQRELIVSVEDMNAEFEKDMLAVRSSNLDAVLGRTKPLFTTNSASQPTIESLVKAELAKESLDWKKIAALCEGTSPNDSFGPFHFLRQHFRSMSAEALVAALEGISTSDIPAIWRDFLVDDLLGCLVVKDPELALTRYTDLLHGESIGLANFRLAKAMWSLAKKDPARATDWFTEQMAAGKLDGSALDGKSETRSEIFEGIISMLLDSHPDAVSRALATMDEGQRAEALRKHSSERLSKENELAFATLVRNQLSPQNQAKIFRNLISRMRSNGADAKVEDFLERIRATPAEQTLWTE